MKVQWQVTLYGAFRRGNVAFLLNAFDDDIEFVSYSPLEVFPFLGHHRGKSAIAEVLRTGYAEFEFVTYEPIFMVCEAENAAVVAFARFIHRKTGRSISTMTAHFFALSAGPDRRTERIYGFISCS